MKKLITAVAVASAFAASFASATTVSSTTLTSIVRADNVYTIYLSTDDKVAGTSFGTLSNWNATQTKTVALTAGQDYYLHIFAQDTDGIAGVLGQFSLSGTDFSFANGTQSLLTNTTNWLANSTGFDKAYTTPTAATVSQVTSSWGSTAGVNSSAQWIWAGNNFDVNQAYFTTKITAVTAPAAVPEPGSLALLGLGLAGVAAVARRRRG